MQKAVWKQNLGKFHIDWFLSKWLKKIKKQMLSLKTWGVWESGKDQRPALGTQDQMSSVSTTGLK